MHEELEKRLADPAVWCLVAERDGTMAGHVSLMAAAAHRAQPDPDPGLAHLWQLFVRSEHWGSGVAGELHAALLAEAAARGFRELRLFTPVAHARARRFYEREGWRAVGEPILVPGFGMKLTEYRFALGSRSGT